jgi:predicted metal-dependent hydrolase
MKNTESSRLEIAGLQIEVVRKAILHLHIAVYPPDGRVRVAAPFWVGQDAIRLAVLDRLAWIRRHQAKFADQARQSEREMVNGETQWFQGRKYRLEIREVPGHEGVALKGLATMEMTVRPSSDADHRRAILERWYRKQLKLVLAPWLSTWEAAIGVKAASWGVRKMRTHWGSCNPKAKRLWFNLELVKKSPDCLEYVVVHELIHLLERRHDARFKELMTQFLPEWRSIRESLNAAPLGQEPREL